MTALPNQTLDTPVSIVDVNPISSLRVSRCGGADGICRRTAPAYERTMATMQTATPIIPPSSSVPVNRASPWAAVSEKS